MGDPRIGEPARGPITAGAGIDIPIVQSLLRCWFPSARIVKTTDQPACDSLPGKQQGRCMRMFAVISWVWRLEAAGSNLPHVPAYLS